MTAATNAGTNTADNDYFIITAPKEDQKIVIIVNNGSGATITAYIVNGAMHASLADSAAQTIVTGKTYAWTIDSAKYKRADGTIRVMLTNANAVALSASAKANVTCLTLG